MAYSETLANRIREQLQDKEGVAEKEMMGGLTFMINDKMCVGIIKDEMMCRIDPERYEEALEKTGCHEMDFTGRPMKGWVMVDESGMKNQDEMNAWIKMALEFNVLAKKSVRKSKAQK